MSELVELSTSTRKREEEIKRIIDKASPVIIWPAEEGVMIVAANRDKRENRIHSIYDRIGCVTLGTFSGGTILWQGAALKASSDGFNLSKGDVSCRIIIKDTSAQMSESFHGFRKGPLFGVEAIFVEVSENRSDDYLAHLNYMGFVSTFGEPRIFGRLESVPSDNSADYSNRAAEEKLTAIWKPDIPLAEVVEMLKREPLFSGLFSASRTEVVVMDRMAVRQNKFKSVFKRTA